MKTKKSFAHSGSIHLAYVYYDDDLRSSLKDFNIIISNVNYIGVVAVNY